MATARDCHILTSYYLSQYNKRYGSNPIVNRNKARWGFDGILYDLSIPETRELIEYYLQTISTTGHSLDWFFNNYDKLMVSKENAEKDEEDRRRLRKESEERVKEWRRKNGGD